MCLLYLFIFKGVHQECYPKLKEMDNKQARELVDKARSAAVSRVNQTILSSNPQVTPDKLEKEPEHPVRRTTIPNSIKNRKYGTPFQSSLKQICRLKELIQTKKHLVLLVLFMNMRL